MADPKKPTVEFADILKGKEVSNVQDDAGKALYPVLVDLLTPRFKDGKMTRQGGRLSLKADSGVWRMSLECPTEGLQTTCIISTLETALAEMEDHVIDGASNWEMTWARRKKQLTPLDGSVQ